MLVWCVVVALSYEQTFSYSNPSLSADGTWSSIYWPIHSPIKREVLELNANVTRVLEGHRVKKCAFWKKFLPRLLSLSKFDYSVLFLHLQCCQLV